MISVYLSGSIIRNDPDYLESLYRPGVDGIEMGFLRRPKDLEKVVRFRDRKGIGLGFHLPVLRTAEPFIKWIPPLDPALLEPYLAEVEKDLRLAGRLGATHAVIHLPSRVWDLAEYPDLTPEVHRELVDRSVSRLDELSGETGVEVHVECDGPNPFFNRIEDFLSIVRGHRHIQFCLDIYKIFFMTRRFYDFTEEDLVGNLSPWTRSLHLINVKEDEAARGLRLPPNPHQRTADGWMDVEGIIRGLVGRCEDLTITFEHCSTELEHEFCRAVGTDLNSYFQEGFDWIRELLEM